MSQVTVPTSRTKKGAVMQLLPKLPPKSSGAHQFFSYMIYHVNHVFVFTVVVLIILKYITPKNGLCHYLKITVLRNLHAKTSQRHLSNFFPQFPRPTESSRTESSRKESSRSESSRSESSRSIVREKYFRETLDSFI